MKYQIIGKNILVTDSIRDAIVKKLSRMDKYFRNDEDILCRAVVRSYTVGAKVEVTIFTKPMIFRAEVRNNDLYAAFDFAIDKLEGQMRKLKTRTGKRHEDAESLGRAIALENLEEELEASQSEEVVRTKSYYLEPMSLEEAIDRMEALGHSFFVYLDGDDNRISVVYHRNDGGYGVIQAENQVK